MVATLLKKRLAQVFSCEFYKILKNTYFIEHHRTTASKSFHVISKLHQRFSANSLSLSFKQTLTNTHTHTHTHTHIERTLSNTINAEPVKN